MSCFPTLKYVRNQRSVWIAPSIWELIPDGHHASHSLLPYVLLLILQRPKKPAPYMANAQSPLIYTCGFLNETHIRDTKRARILWALKHLFKMTHSNLLLPSLLLRLPNPPSCPHPFVQLQFCSLIRTQALGNYLWSNYFIYTYMYTHIYMYVCVHIYLLYLHNSSISSLRGITTHNSPFDIAPSSLLW